MLALAALLALLTLGVWLYCLFDVLSTDEGDVRHLPKFTWFLIVLLLFLVGAAGWLMLGRPRGRDLNTGASSLPPTATRPGDIAPPPRGPDDDPEFLQGLDRRFREEDC